MWAGTLRSTLFEINAIAAGGAMAGSCFEVSVTAGITEASSADDIAQIMERADTKQKIIARYQCGKEGSSK